MPEHNCFEKCEFIVTPLHMGNDTAQWNEPHDEKTYFMLYANKKGADQPAYPRSLISTFVFAA